MKLVFAAPVESDLDEIADWIAQDNPTSALRFIQELRSACIVFADMAEAYPLVPRYESLGIQRKIFGDYLLLYRIKGTAVEIIHILHGARNYDAILFVKGGG